MPYNYVTNLGVFLPKEPQVFSDLQWDFGDFTSEFTLRHVIEQLKSSVFDNIFLQ